MNVSLSSPSIYTAKDFDSGDEVRWCPGCGDYAILKQVQQVMPQIGVSKENIVFVSGIGCSGRFPYYMNTYGLHTIHGRATAIASGIKVANPDLSVWVIIGDGDGFSIGLNHTLQLLRRNLNINILLFNNQIYGLTKGQYSPTSEQHKRTVSTPSGSLDFPFNPLALVLAAGGTFIARTVDKMGAHLRAMLLAAHQHPGTSFIEIYQNCNIFNDKAFDTLTDKNNAMMLHEGQPIQWGENKTLLHDGYKIAFGEKENAPNDALWVHNSYDIGKAQLLINNLFTDDLPRPLGILYQNPHQPRYEEMMMAQVTQAQKTNTSTLDTLLRGRDFWKVV